MSWLREAVELHRATGQEPVALLDEISDVYADGFGQPPHRHGAEHVRLFRERFLAQHQRDGACLVIARAADEVVGFGFGLTLSSSKSWWFDLATEVEPGLTEETPGRTFALLELVVRPDYQRCGIATMLHDRLLSERRERRATLTVLPNADAAQSLYAKLGWYRVAQKYNPLPGSPLFDVLLKDLSVRNEQRSGRSADHPV